MSCGRAELNHRYNEDLGTENWRRYIAKGGHGLLSVHFGVDHERLRLKRGSEYCGFVITRHHFYRSDTFTSPLKRLRVRQRQPESLMSQVHPIRGVRSRGSSINTERMQLGHPTSRKRVLSALRLTRFTVNVLLPAAIPNR